MAGKKEKKLWVVSANDLLLGDVVYLSEQVTWTRDIQQARGVNADGSADSLVEQARLHSNEVVGVELVAISHTGNAIVPLTLREQLRQRGPSVVANRTATPTRI